MVLTDFLVGEITDHDVAIMEKGYKWMIYTPPVRYVRYIVITHHLLFTDMISSPLLLELSVENGK